VTVCGVSSLAAQAGSAAQPLVDILQATARETSEIAGLACSLQSALSPLRTAAEQGRHAAIELQSLDVITQRLAGISDFLNALALRLPPHWMCDVAAAARVVTLSDLALRLSCADADTGVADYAGIVDLF